MGTDHAGLHERIAFTIISYCEETLKTNKPIRSYLNISPLKLVILLLPTLLILGSLKTFCQKPARSADDQTTLRVTVDLVNVLFTVTDSGGRLITNLNKEDFLIEEDGKRQEIAYFSKEVSLPLTM